MTYAIIKVAGKQYRVREGERLLVDRLHEDDGATFAPTVLLVGGDGAPQLDPSDGVVSAKVVGRTKGPEDPHRQVQEAHGLPSPHGISGIADADRDRVDRRRQARSLERQAEGREDGDEQAVKATVASPPAAISRPDTRT